jgi:Protein of unknown function (DUF1403)
MMLAGIRLKDASPADGGEPASDWSNRHLFERLVALGVARELTGPPIFRLDSL